MPPDYRSAMRAEQAHIAGKVRRASQGPYDLLEPDSCRGRSAGIQRRPCRCRCPPRGFVRPARCGYAEQSEVQAQERYIRSAEVRSRIARPSLAEPRRQLPWTCDEGPWDYRL
jgi:hypothetical protein